MWLWWVYRVWLMVVWGWCGYGCCGMLFDSGLLSVCVFSQILRAEGVCGMVYEWVAVRVRQVEWIILPGDLGHRRRRRKRSTDRLTTFD